MRAARKRERSKHIKFNFIIVTGQMD